MHLLRRRILSILFLVIIIIGSYFLYKYVIRANDYSFDYIPNKATIIIKVPLKNFSIDGIANQANYWSQISNIPIINKVSGQLIGFESMLKESNGLKDLIGGSNFYISAFATKSDNFGLLYTIKLSSNHNSDSLQNLISDLLGNENTSSKRIFMGEEINEFNLDNGREFSYAVIDNYFLGSFTSFLVDDAISDSQNKLAIGFNKEFMAGLNPGTNKLEVIWIYKNLSNFLKIFSEKRSGDAGLDVLEFYSTLSNYKLKVDSNNISGSSNKEIYNELSFVNHFSGQVSGNSKLFQFLPNNTSVVKQVRVNNISAWIQSLKSDRSKIISGYSIDEYLQGINNKYKTNVSDYLTKWCNGNYAQVILEPLNSNYNDFVFAVFETDNPTEANAQLKDLAQKVSVGDNLIMETYKNSTIVNINIKGVLPLIYGNIFNRVQFLNYMVYENFIIFGNSKDALKIMLDALSLNSKVIDNMSISEKEIINDKGINYILYSNLRNSESLINAHVNEKWQSNYTNIKNQLASVKSFIYSYHFNSGDPNSKFLVSFSDKPSHTTKIAWKNVFANELVTKPFLLKSSTSKVYKILVQDIKNNLYCLDETGEIIWQKKLAEKIIDNVEAIDLQNDGQTQYLFNTNNFVYIIDDQGDNYLNYPIKLPVQTNYSLQLADNTETKELTYYIYCTNNQVYAYNINGRPLSNWKYKREIVELSRNIQSVLNSGSPELVLSYANGKIEIVNSYGKLIKSYKHENPMSSHNIYYQNDKENSELISSDQLGNAVYLLPSGKIKIINNPTLSQNHSFYYSDIGNDNFYDFIYLDEGELTAYDQNMIMINYKRYSSKMVQYISVSNIFDNSKSIGLVSKEANKIFLFNSDGIELSGFPVEGSSEYSIVDLQNSGYINLITISEKNKLINYRIR